VSDAQTFAFLNPFVSEPRLELLIDWIDAWSEADPFTGADFRLAVTDLAPGGGAPAAPTTTTDAYPLKLDPILPPEVREQLLVVGRAEMTSKAHGDVRWLAPHFVSETVKELNRTADCTSGGGTRANASPRYRGAQLFSSPNLMADLNRWTSNGSRSDGKVKRLNDEINVRMALSGLIERVNRSPTRGAEAPITAPEKALRGRSKYTIDGVAQDRMGLRSLLDDAQKADFRDSIADLERAIRLRSVDELLTYAEALRRDQVYSRLRAEEAPKNYLAMTAAAGGDNDPKTICARRADLRRLSRDEPVLGAIFHVLRWFTLPNDAQSWQGRLIWVMPFRGSEPLTGFEAKPTLVAFAGGIPVTVLRRDLRPTYFAQSLTVRQIAPALLLDGDDEDKFGNPRDPLARLLKMLDSGQSCPPVTHKSVQGGDPSGRNGDDPLHVAFARNNDAHRPNPDSKAFKYIFDDARRELADAAESVRRIGPPFDSIGITWERFAAEQAVFGENGTPFLTGFKGYRIDVREVRSGESTSWKSLCTVERELFDRRQQAVMRSRLPREGYVIQPVQNHSEDKRGEPTALTLPADFVLWAGGSVVTPASLDRLGQSLAPPTEDGPLVTMRELGLTGINPRYGRRYDFRVRGVGLSGTGPASEFAGDDGAHDAVDFRRGVPMDAPVAETEYFDLEPLDDQGRALPVESGKRIPDVPLLAQSLAAHIRIMTAPPLAHWRIALHARGLTRQEQAVNGGPAFERACARFVTRTRNNWRHRSAGLSAPEELKPAAHLSSLDPHCTGIELVTRVWFPFSSNPDDRYVVTGRNVQHRHDIQCASFSELVTRGEDFIETSSTDGEFDVLLDRSSLPPEATPDSAPRMLAGFHGMVELVAQWAEDAVRHFPAEDGRRRWTRNLFVGVHEGRKVGGKVRRIDEVFKAGGPAFATDTHFVDASYGGLEQPERERDLRMPQPEAPPGPDCEPSERPPALAQPAYWRKKFFDRDCNSFPVGPDCEARRQEYRRFVAQQLGQAELASSAEEDYSRKGYDERIVLRLLPTMVPAPQRARSLVLPTFTFPLEVDYDPGVVLPRSGDARSVTAKLGTFGSGGVVRIDVTAKGSGFTVASPPKIKVAAPFEGEGAPVAEARVSGIDPSRQTLETIEVFNPGHDYKQAPEVTIQGGAGTGAAAEAKLGLIGRRLPWVDVDIVWAIRLGWRVPLSGGPIERPLELAAVREFRLFRRDLRQAGNRSDLPREFSPPLATLTRPGVDTLQSVDLDLVEFTWVDAITDREPHEYEYKVVAVPEDPNTFTSQTWFTFRVDVPDSRIAPRPESMRFLPMLAHKEDGQTTRSLALYFSDSAIRGRADHTTMRFARTADDPMLPIEPRAKVGSLRGSYIPKEWHELFPPGRVNVRVVSSWQEIAADPAGLEGSLAPTIDCDPPSEDRRARLFVIASKTDDGRRLIWPESSAELGNPFFKLHLSTYDERRLPALVHTAASEPAESDWLQFYPDDLEWLPAQNVIAIASPWGAESADPENLVWYRFHFFAQATTELLFHVSTFYSHAPSLTVDDARREALVKSLTRFGWKPQKSLALSVRAEEGLLASTYAIDATSGKRLAVADPAGRFVVLRSCSELKDVVIQF
jgi:hypothetical protein